MEAETHPDPFNEAINHGLQRAVQVTSFAGTAAQVLIYHQKTHARAAAEHDERARRALLAQTRAERDAARSAWSPALDPQWLRAASLRDTAQAWGAAMPYADRNVPWYEPAAATALRKTEERLRDLHPFAMARYDRLRADGLSPAEAMHETAPLFAFHPRARDSPYAPLAALSPGTGAEAAWTADPLAPGSEPGDTPSPDTLEARGQGIVTALQDRAQAEGREPLGHDELRAVLETITNLPADTIRRITPPAPIDGRTQPGPDSAATAERARAAGLDAATGLTAAPVPNEHTENLGGARDTGAVASAATARSGQGTRPWERDFPVSINEVVAATATTPAQAATPPHAPARASARQPATPQRRRS
jgi:hypothetical protein